MCVISIFVWAHVGSFFSFRIFLFCLLMEFVRLIAANQRQQQNLGRLYGPAHTSERNIVAAIAFFVRNH